MHICDCEVDEECEKCRPFDFEKEILGKPTAEVRTTMKILDKDYVLKTIPGHGECWIPVKEKKFTNDNIWPGRKLLHRKGMFGQLEVVITKTLRNNWGIVIIRDNREYHEHNIYSAQFFTTKEQLLNKMNTKWSNSDYLDFP